MNKIIFCILIFSLSLPVISAEIAAGRIVEIKGSGFISKDGKTKEISKGDPVYANSEIVVEHSGQITFTDNADHRYHLGNASSAFIGANFLELRAGDVWFQSLNKTDNYQVKTANAIVDYQGGEAILSYDSAKGKTQLMVINGMMTLSNLRTPELNLSVAEGNFSFIDLNYDAGAPRDPTPVGEKTYKLLVGIFHGIGPMDKKSAEIFTHAEPKREIASAHEAPHHEAAVKELPKTEVVTNYAEQLLQKPKKAKKVVSHKKQNSFKPEVLSVHIYGLKKAPEKSAARVPASVHEESLPVKATPQVEAKEKDTDKLLNALKNL